MIKKLSIISIFGILSFLSTTSAKTTVYAYLKKDAQGKPVENAEVDLKIQTMMLRLIKLATSNWWI